MTLKEYISKFYGGNQSAFASAINKPRQQISNWLKSDDWYVYDGLLMQKKCDLPPVE